MTVQEAMKLQLGKTVVNLRYMEGNHKVVVTYWDAQGLVKATIKEIDPNANKLFSIIYSVGENIDCMLRDLSF